MKLFLQTQSTECALACLAMICSAHGAHFELSEIRRRCSISQKGTTLQQLVEYANQLGFTSRPLSLQLEETAQLALPCILHWDMNHFVVLTRVSRGGRRFHISDPAIGERVLTLSELSEHFTGVALELTPGSQFTKRDAPPKVSLNELTSGYHGTRAALLMIFSVSIALELFSLGAPLLNQLVIDDVLGAGDKDLLTVLIVGFALILLIQTTIGFFRGWLVLMLSQSISIQWAGNVFNHLVRLPLDYFEKRHLGDIASRFSSVSALQKTLTTSAIEALIDGLLAVGALGMMIWYSGPLSAITIASVALYGLLRIAFYKAFKIAATERIFLAAKESSHFLESVRAIAPLKLFGRESEREARWRNLMVDVQNRDVRTAKMGVIFAGAKTFILGAENLAVLWVGALLIIGSQNDDGGTWTVGMLMAYMSYKGQFSARVVSLIGFLVEFRMLSMHTERLGDITTEAKDDTGRGEGDLSHLPRTLELRNVSFRYAEGEPWILRNVNLNVNAGEMVALTGPSGSGKTTLLKVALGLLSPSEGEVLYGGIPVRKLGLGSYRGIVGTVLQDDALFSGSIEDNICFFDIDVAPERIVECARLAHIHEEITKMPMGYHTLIGDLGSGISGGQKQRILLARAFYKRPSVLALDEATSHLDTANEKRVNSSIRSLNLTAFVIAHRTETVAASDRIVRLDRGVVKQDVAHPSKNSQPQYLSL